MARPPRDGEAEPRRSDTYYDAVEKTYVRLSGEPNQQRTPLTAEEVESLPRTLRSL